MSRDYSFNASHLNVKNNVVLEFDSRLPEGHFVGGETKNGINDHGGGDVIVVGQLLRAHGGCTPGPL